MKRIFTRVIFTLRDKKKIKARKSLILVLNNGEQRDLGTNNQ